MKKRLIVVGILVTALAISAWGYKNPAAVYCSLLGYDYTIKQTPEGDVGYCKFSDGTECQGSDFLQGACGMQHSYCAQKGYQQRTGTGTDCGSNDPTATCLLCIMPNGSAVEVGNAMDLYSKLNDIPIPVTETTSTITQTTQTTEPTPTTEETPVTTSPVPETIATTTIETTQTTEPTPTTQGIIGTTYPEPPTTIETPTTGTEQETTPPETSTTIMQTGTTTTTIPAPIVKPFDPLSYLPYALALIILAIAVYFVHKKANDEKIKKEREDFLKWKQEQGKK